MTDRMDDAEHGLLTATTQRLLSGLRWAVLLITSTIVLIPAVFLRHLSTYNPLWIQIACYAAVSMVVIRGIALVARKQAWGNERWLAVAVVFAAAATSRWFLPPEAVVSSADWAFGIFGWVMLILLLDRPMVWLSAVLAIHELQTAVMIIIWLPHPRDSLLNLAAGSIGAIGYPLAAAAASTALRSVARTATRAAREAERIHTADALEARLHANRQSRFTDVDQIASPLLRGLADRTLNPDDPAVRRCCAVAASRMRRLFAETDTTDDPLLHELRQGADVAERLGIDVDLEPRGAWPQPPVSVRRALIDPVLIALSSATSTARVTVVGLNEELIVSVVADCQDVNLAQAQHSAIKISVVAFGRFTWVEAVWSTRHLTTRNLARTN